MDKAKPAAAARGKLELEEALLQIVHRRHHQSLRQRQRTERAKKGALGSAVRVADLLVNTVDGGMQELFVDEKRIELEARVLLGTIAWYRKQTDQWLAATNAISSDLKICFKKQWIHLSRGLQHQERDTSPFNEDDYKVLNHTPSQGAIM
ncbi:biogenesis of lysosome-related organelles complex 1 subunit 1-like isoform X1 [Phragmites australis]|uniref:biogenesis of lysosome-related organelles complex 1 subunit 1-like isoform X1 n=1 Tax=Phragmites australis TaxID=29695 RepID=UPI002D790079|nr:biogenesis of lysosome-related organelles complex 1 subunit 1-like isoform X1 [Phragmites australis]